MKNCIVWSFSTWKTTITDKIEEKNINKFTFYSDIERKIWEKYWNIVNLTEKEREIFQLDLIDYQIELEQNINKKEINFFNNSLITTLAYCFFTFDLKTYKKIEKSVENFLEENPYDQIFYLPIEFEIEDDWIRHIDSEFQKNIDLKIKEILQKFNLWYTLINWSIKNRTDLILKEI